ncbi:chaplin [Streptomyces actuosus]|uniref:chaplin n=1 Tax=Streptomyces actuosus TaxID=1885 RepID=UPI0027DA5A8E|nr:chaplin [Streptomyces actuosus]
MFGTSAARAAPSVPCGPGDACAVGLVAYSPGVASGHLVQIPIDLDLNACGNTADVPALLDPAAGTRCVSR